MFEILVLAAVLDNSLAQKVFRFRVLLIGSLVFKVCRITSSFFGSNELRARGIDMQCNLSVARIPWQFPSLLGLFV